MTPARRTNEQILASLSCSIVEAAQVLDVGRRSVEAMCDDGSLHSFPVGRRKRIGVASLKRLAGARPDPA